MVHMSEILLHATRFRVERREYDVPGHGRVRRELVCHPGAVLILPLLDEDTVIMIRNYRFSVGAEILELPAGTLEPDEPPIDCAARELIEETGYDAGRIEPLCAFYTSPGFTDERMHCFVARDLTEVGQQLEATEQIRIAPMPYADAIAATTDGRIVDAKSIAALLIHHQGKQQP